MFQNGVAVDTKYHGLAVDATKHGLAVDTQKMDTMACINPLL